MTRRLDPKVIRPGDSVDFPLGSVRRSVRRVGYDLTLTEAQEQVRRDPVSLARVRAFLGRPEPEFKDITQISDPLANDTLMLRGLDVLAYQKVSEALAANPQRSVHFQPDPVPPGVLYVLAKSMARTGRYYPPSVHARGTFTPEWGYEPADDEPGGLSEAQVQVLLLVSQNSGSNLIPTNWASGTKLGDKLWIVLGSDVVKRWDLMG